MITPVKRKKGFRHNETLKHENTLRNIFIDRTKVNLGLTKKEVIAKYYNYDIREVLDFSPDKINNLWKPISEAIYYLKKDRIIAIVPIQLPSGTVLDDSSLENSISTRPRKLTTTTYVYHSCSDLSTAQTIREKYDKIANGFVKAGDRIEEITKEQIENNPIMELVVAR